MPPNTVRPPTERSRRRFLAGGTALVSVLTSGCLSALPPLGNSQRYGRLNAPPADDPAYRKWLPTPSVADLPAEDYHFAAMQSTAPRPDAPTLFTARRANLKADLDYFGPGFETYDLVVHSSVGTAIEASFDRERVHHTLTKSGYSTSGTYRQYDLFARQDGHRRIALGDSTLVWTSSYSHSHPNLEAVLDAGDGERPRFHETSDRFRTLSRAAGGCPHVSAPLSISDPTGRPALVVDAFRFDDTAAYQVVHYCYDAKRVPSEQALEATLRDDARFTDEATAFDVQVDGPIATVETRVPLHAAETVPAEYDLPQVTWGMEYDPTADTVTVRHEAGESVPAGRVFYDLARPSLPGRVEKQPLFTDRDTVAAGAETRIQLDDFPSATGVSIVYSTEALQFHPLFGRALGGRTDG